LDGVTMRRRLGRIVGHSIWALSKAFCAVLPEKGRIRMLSLIPPGPIDASVPSSFSTSSFTCAI
jgi:hypothetical protein